MSAVASTIEVQWLQNAECMMKVVLTLTVEVQWLQNAKCMMKVMFTLTVEVQWLQNGKSCSFSLLKDNGCRT